jgi:hypothetical protein
MDQWRRELDDALKKRLQDSDDEFEDNFVLKLCQQVLDECRSSSKQPKVGNSRPGRRYVYREREACDERLYRDYFAKDSTFDVVKFRR